ncbi:hypothetical protein CBR_g36319 [Chara braunii]|uniref:Uncharacterized protein n=1 Tax=Chara braunii TaxID=69332 RepID=A0A388LKE3_CHABU|nr:hypothetical protein CBR_g36319 [Chara braunii]|eukprot:GBG82788.1 hypothetical protein CBR_g36319 [Chara braunii]
MEVTSRLDSSTSVVHHCTSSTPINDAPLLELYTHQRCNIYRTGHSNSVPSHKTEINAMTAHRPHSNWVLNTDGMSFAL